MPKELEGDVDNYINEIADIPSDDTSNTNTNSDDGGSNVDDKGFQPVDKQPTQQSEPPKFEATPKGADQQQTQKKESEQPSQATQTGNDNQPRMLAPGVFRQPNGSITDAKGQIIPTLNNLQNFANRAHQQVERLRARMTDMDQTIADQQRQLQENKVLNGVAANSGLSNDDIAFAMDLGARIKRGGPAAISAAKEVVALIAAQGYNVTDILGKEVGDSVDMRAIQQMLKPFQQQVQQTEQTNEQKRVAETKYRQFVADNEFADVHGNEIVFLSKRDGISIQAAYNQLFLFATRNGLDFSQPLGPQIEAKRAELAQQQQQQRQQPNGRPMPNRAATSREFNGASNAQPQYADPDDDWGSIIKGAMNLNS